MALPLRILPIVERWDCQGCGNCCRGSVIPLDEADRSRLLAQKWEQHPEYLHTPVMVRHGWLRPRYELARRADESCVFLTAAGRCRIHELHGAEAKPLTCQVYPLQVVPLETKAVLTIRRSCPAAAADEGRELSAHLPFARHWAEQKGLGHRPAPVPRITRSLSRDWPDAETVLSSIENLLRDERWPIVRRLVHGLIFCTLLEQAQCKDFDRAKFTELIGILEAAVPEEVGELFRERPNPTGTAQLLFRQTASEYFRLHPRYRQPNSWLNRLPTPLKSIRIMRGRGMFPFRWTDQPPVSFEQLANPLGPLPPELSRTIVRYFEAAATARQYAVLGRPGWSITERFRALALGYPALQWLLRMRSPEEAVTSEQIVAAISAIERGQGFEPLEGLRHRHRVQTLETLGQLPTLLAWYAR